MWTMHLLPYHCRSLNFNPLASLIDDGQFEVSQKMIGTKNIHILPVNKFVIVAVPVSAEFKGVSTQHCLDIKLCSESNIYRSFLLVTITFSDSSCLFNL